MTAQTYGLGDQVSFQEGETVLEGTVCALTTGSRRQMLVVRLADGEHRTITVNLRQHGEIIAASMSLQDARTVAMQYLAQGHVPGVSETGLVNLLASALVAATEPGRAA